MTGDTSTTGGTSTTTSTDPSVVAPGAALAAHVRGYAEAVRLHLTDLGPEVTDDLTGGLEADLTEALADAVPSVAMRSAAGDAPGHADVVLDVARVFGPASAYAAELRNAAGLPPAGPPRRPGLRGALAHRAARSRERWARRGTRWAQHLEPVTSHPWWAALRELAGSLRPVWWVARGWVLGVLLVVILGDSNLGVMSSDNGGYLVPASGSQFLIMAGCALVSVQWGRGRWLLPRVGSRLTVAAGVLAVLATPAVLGSTGDLTLGGSPSSTPSYDRGYQDGIEEAHYASYDGGAWGEDGVWVDGTQVANLFAFDANGDPIRDVQIFDDRGRPVRTVAPEVTDELWEVPQIDGGWYLRPTDADDGHARWNVYPLQGLPENAMEWTDDDTADDGSALVPAVGVRPEDMPWPFLKAPTTISRSAAEEPPAAEEPSAEPTPRPSPSSAKPAPSSTPDETAEPTEPASSGDQGTKGQVTVADAAARR
jgi:hypothetical protein